VKVRDDRLYVLAYTLAYRRRVMPSGMIPAARRTGRDRPGRTTRTPGNACARTRTASATHSHVANSQSGR